MADRKMTLKERAIQANMMLGERNEADEERWLAGWHARGRADRIRKAERVNADMLKLLLDIKAHDDKTAPSWAYQSPQVVALRKRLHRIIDRARRKA